MSDSDFVACRKDLPFYNGVPVQQSTVCRSQVFEPEVALFIGNPGMVAGSESVVGYYYLIGRISSDFDLAVFQRDLLSRFLNNHYYLLRQLRLFALSGLHVIELKAFEIEIGHSCAINASGSDWSWASAARAGFGIVGHLSTGELFVYSEIVPDVGDVRS